MAVFTETIKLEDEVSAPAARARDELGRFVKGAGEAEGALAKVSGASGPAGSAMSGLSGKTFDAANAMQVGKETIGSAIEGIKSAFSSLAQGDVKGAVVGLSDAVGDMAKLLDLVVPGFGQVVSAVVKIAGGLVGITAGLIQSGAELAIEASTAKTQMIAMFDALGEGKITGEQVDNMLDGMSSKLGITKDAMVPLVQKFAAMGVTSQAALEKMTTAALQAKAIMKGSDAAADAFVNLSKKIQLAGETGLALKIPLKGLGSLAEMGLTVTDVAKEMGTTADVLGGKLKAGLNPKDAKAFGDAMQSALGKKGAGALETMSLTTKNLGEMLQQYIGDMFEDLMPVIKPFLEEVKKLFGIFDSKTKPSGDALKTGIMAVLKTIFSWATKLVPLVRTFLLNIIIYALKAYIALKPIVKTLVDFWKQHDGMGILMTVLKGIGVVLLIVGAAIGVVVGFFFAMSASVAVVGAALVALVGVILNFATDASRALGDWVVGAATAASDFIKGLVDGISKGATDVVNAVKGVADGAVNAFKGALGIHSPSKIGLDLGGNFGGSIGSGIEDSGGDVHGASSGLATQAVKGASAPVASAAPASSGASGGTVFNVNVQIDGAGKSAQEITDEMVAQSFERYALSAGF